MAATNPGFHHLREVLKARAARQGLTLPDKLYIPGYRWRSAIRTKGIRGLAISLHQGREINPEGVSAASVQTIEEAPEAQFKLVPLQNHDNMVSVTPNRQPNSALKVGQNISSGAKKNLEFTPTAEPEDFVHYRQFHQVLDMLAAQQHVKLPPDDVYPPGYKWEANTSTVNFAGTGFLWQLVQGKEFPKERVTEVHVNTVQAAIKLGLLRLVVHNAAEVAGVPERQLEASNPHGNHQVATQGEFNTDAQSSGANVG